MAVEFQTPKEQKPIAGNIPIWRYMGLEKFLDLIVSNRMRFARASLLSDRRELNLPLDKLESDYYRESFEMETGSGGVMYARVDEMRKRVGNLKDRVFLNCWSIGHQESYALWKIYLGGSKTGVAIKSSVAALKKSLAGASGGVVHIARVTYTDDVKTEGIPDSYFITTKSSHYEYENELRLFTFDEENENDSILWQRHFASMGATTMDFEVDTNTLINEIYLSPFVFGGFRKTFEKIVRKLNPGIEAGIRASTIRDS